MSATTSAAGVWASTANRVGVIKSAAVAGATPGARSSNSRTWINKSVNPSTPTGSPRWPTTGTTLALWSMSRASASEKVASNGSAGGTGHMRSAAVSAASDNGRSDTAIMAALTADRSSCLKVSWRGAQKKGPPGSGSCRPYHVPFHPAAAPLVARTMPGSANYLNCLEIEHLEFQLAVAWGSRQNNPPLAESVFGKSERFVAHHRNPTAHFVPQTTLIADRA